MTYCIQNSLCSCGTFAITLDPGDTLVGSLIVLVTSLLGRAMVLVMGGTMVVVMAMDEVGVGQNIVDVNTEGQLSLLTEVAV